MSYERLSSFLKWSEWMSLLDKIFRNTQIDGAASRIYSDVSNSLPCIRNSWKKWSPEATTRVRRETTQGTALPDKRPVRWRNRRSSRRRPTSARRILSPPRRSSLPAIGSRREPRPKALKEFQSSRTTALRCRALRTSGKLNYLWRQTPRSHLRKGTKEEDCRGEEGPFRQSDPLTNNRIKITHVLSRSLIRPPKP